MHIVHPNEQNYCFSIRIRYIYFRQNTSKLMPPVGAKGGHHHNARTGGSPIGKPLVATCTEYPGVGENTHPGHSTTVLERADLH